jgi:rod shape-determining protein MreD
MARVIRSWPAMVSFVAAIALEIVPLPDFLVPLRPPLSLMALIYWTMMWPERFGLLTAFVLGITLDILHGQLLGQNALALLVVTYLTVRFHLQIRIFPLWQLTMTVMALLCIAVFMLFVVEGIAGFGMLGLSRWPHIVSGTLLWPLVMGLLNRIRTQSEFRSTHF